MPSHPFAKGSPLEQFIVVFHSGANGDVWDRFFQRARKARLRVSGSGLGDFYGGTLICDRFDGGFFVEFGPAGSEFAADSGHRQFGLADHARERAPFFSERVFLHARCHARAFRDHFGVEQFGFVGLAGVEETPLRVGIVLRNLGEVAARVEHFLCGEHADECHLHRRFDADALFVGFDGGELRLLAEDFATEAKFAACDDGLLDEEAFLAAADGAAANFVAGVADGGIGIKAGLLLAAFGGADLRFGLAERGIVLTRDGLDLVESDERGFCV